MDGPAQHLFSVNPGRSGSWYLGQLLGTGEGVLGLHEAKPQMVGEYVAMVNEAGYEASYARRRFKVDEIRQARAASGARVYADSSHMFIKTFHDVVARELESVEVIVLRRPLALVLRSFRQLSFLDRHAVSFEWMTSPNAATAAIRAIAPDREMTPFERCIAYLIDIEARAIRFRRDHPEIRLHEVTLDEINTRGGVERLFADLRITPTRATWELVGRRINERREKKGVYRWFQPVGRYFPTVGTCRREIGRYLAKAAALGIEVPRSLLR